jgi:hypothetical protein
MREGTKRTFHDKWRLTSLSNKAITLATIVIALAGVLQFGTAFFQWREMRETGEQTQQMLGLVQNQIAAANRLADTADTANKNALDSNRPWLGTTGVTVEGTTIKPGVMLTVHVPVVNAGNRPAKLLRFRAQVDIFEKFPKAPSYNVNTTPFPENGQDIVLPHVPIEVSFPFGLAPQQYQDVVAKKKRLYIYAIVEYEDVNASLRKTVHTTTICYFWMLNDKNTFATCPVYNDAN